jgi:nicotinamidase/pyrazinamidase
MTDTALDFDDRTALVIVDVQNDFADRRGGLYVEEGEQVIPLINGLAAQGRSAGALVVYTQDWHPESTPHFQKDGGTWPVHCVAGTWGAELHPDLHVEDPLVRKGAGGEDGYSGFTARDVSTGEERKTDLQSLLDEHDIRSLVLTGLAQDVCVKETALDARRLGYDVTVVVDATRPVNVTVGDGQRALDAMVAVGAQLRRASE